MRRRHVMLRADRPRASHPEEGSALVAALAIGLVVATVVTMLATRSLGESIASAADIERAQVAALAEFGVATAIAELDAGLALELRRTSASGDRDIDVTVPDDAIGMSTRVTAVAVQVSSQADSDEIRIVSTATVGSRTHTLAARVRPSSTVDLLLLRDYETVDPVVLRGARSECTSRRGDPDRAARCIGTSLPQGVLDGPVHSNDVIGLSGPTAFGSLLSTSHLDSAGGSVGPALRPGVPAEVVLAAPFGLHHRSEIVLPRSTAAVAQDTHVTCRFRGPTLVRLDGRAVRVTSPRSVVRDDDPTGPEAAIGCVGVDRDLLVAPTTIELPARAVIEIVRDTRTDCSAHPLGLAPDEDDARDWWCSDGDAFVWGSYRGARTILAQDSIQIVWDVVPQDLAIESGHGLEGVRASGDTLGLVAGDSIVLRRPVGRPDRRRAPHGPNIAFAGPSIAPFGDHPLDAPTASPVTWDAPVIVAALVALRGSVGIQNPTMGEMRPDPVTVHGSVAMRFSGLFFWEVRDEAGAVVAEMGHPLVLRYDRTSIDSPPPGMPVTDRGGVRILSLTRTG